MENQTARPTGFSNSGRERVNAFLIREAKPEFQNMPLSAVFETIDVAEDGSVTFTLDSVYTISGFSRTVKVRPSSLIFPKTAIDQKVLNEAVKNLRQIQTMSTGEIAELSQYEITALNDFAEFVARKSAIHATRAAEAKAAFAARS